MEKDSLKVACQNHVTTAKGLSVGNNFMLASMQHSALFKKGRIFFLSPSITFQVGKRGWGGGGVGVGGREQTENT